MLFDQLNSNLIKSGIISRLAFSLGFKLINTAQRAKRERIYKPLDFELGTPETSAQEEHELARRNWSEFKAYAESNSFPIETLGTIAEAYIRGAGKPITTASPAVLSLRASVSGKTIAGFKASEDKARLVTLAKAEEQVNSIVASMQDLDCYANDFYNHCHIDDFGALVSSSVEIQDIITDEFCLLTYPKILKSQLTFWERFNNWDDAELVLIQADQALLASSNA